MLVPKECVKCFHFMEVSAIELKGGAVPSSVFRGGSEVHQNEEKLGL